jgi:hypothetical protein
MALPLSGGRPPMSPLAERYCVHDVTMTRIQSVSAR